MMKRIALATVTSRVHDISVANATLMAADLQELDSPDAEEAEEAATDDESEAEWSETELEEADSNQDRVHG